MSEVWVAQFYGYFDKGGASDTLGVFVAGAVASVACWEKLNRAWPRMLEHHGLTLDDLGRRMLHMTEFVGSGRSDEARWALYEEAVELIEHHIAGFVGVGAFTEDVRRVVSVDCEARTVRPKPKDVDSTAYASLGNKTIGVLRDWWLARCGLPPQDLAIYFENGDYGRGKLLDLYYATYPDPDDRPAIAFQPKGPPGFQIADMLAWSTNRLMCSDMNPKHPSDAEIILAHRLNASPARIGLGRAPR